MTFLFEKKKKFFLVTRHCDQFEFQIFTAEILNVSMKNINYAIDDGM